ncbi:ATPase family AAA domain-containing protein 2-like [Saccoglossus kowalevskii]
MVKTRHSGGLEPEDEVEFLSLRQRRTRRSDQYSNPINERPSKDLSIRGRGRPKKHNDDDTRPSQNIRCSSRQKTGKTEGHLYMNGDADCVRRSSRRRKAIYSTYNTSLLGNVISGDLDMNFRNSDREDESREQHKDTEEEEEEEEDVGGEDNNDVENGDTDSGDSSLSEFELKTREQEKRRREEEQEYLGLDLYTRVKRPRPPPKERNEYGVPIKTRDDSDSDSDSESDSEDETSSSDTDGLGNQRRRTYFLREKKRAPQRFAVEHEGPIRKPKKCTLFDSPSRRHRNHYQGSLTPIRSPFRRRRHATHNSSSTSSSDSGDDERRFERRKSKSMSRNRLRCLPMNLLPEDIAASGPLKDRTRIGTSLADIDPMNIDRSVTFEGVGGLVRHILALKEMVVFPLLYPEVFEKFKIAPPRGVLFHGPPGTGKTLVARALANECSQGEKRVAFFMRKGADCLSKWVGESERQLRLLFDQAYTMRPAIIFFDEIDGLAPVRSSRQDQIHSSIVSTLLALMDGLDNRGEIVVIGATNRIDSIDPALRRPGRFDREFLFPLPSAEARYSILKIHTKDWEPKLSESFLQEVAEMCVGYAGADIKALCTEAALLALRRRYPQIYTSTQKLQLDLDSIQLIARDFYQAMQNIVPSSQRSVTSPGRALSLVIQPLLQYTYKMALETLTKLFPASSSNCDEKGFSACQFSSMHRPRLLIAGEPGLGQSSHLAPAILHHLERFHVHCLDLPALYSVNVTSPEESCVQVFREARGATPSIIYMPHIGQWWNIVSDTLRATFLTLLQDLPPSLSILLLATSEQLHMHLDTQLQQLFNPVGGEVLHIRSPTTEERQEFFEDLIIHQASKAPRRRKHAAARLLEELPVAQAPEPRQLTEEEIKKLEQQEEVTMRELRLFLRSILTRLASDKKFKLFIRPVDLEEVPDYLDVISNPMDMSTMMKKIDLHQYCNIKEFLADIDLICANALEYNPDRDPSDKVIRHRACEMKDIAHAIVDSDFNPEFGKLCLDIEESRKRRGETQSRSAPQFYHVKPLEKPVTASTSNASSSKRARSIESNPENTEGDSTANLFSDSTPKRRKRKRRGCRWSKGLLSKPRTKPKVSLQDKTDCVEKSSEKDNSTNEDIRVSDCESGPVLRSELSENDMPVEVESSEDRAENSCDSNIDTPFCKSTPSSQRKVRIQHRPMIEESETSHAEEKSPLKDKQEAHKSRNSSTIILSLTKDIDDENESHNGEENNSDKETNKKQETLPIRRLTRRKAADTQTQKAIEILQEPEPPLIVDKGRLKNLLDYTVEVSEHFNIETLEKLHSTLSQCIYCHRNDYNKTQLIQEMEAKVKAYSEH